MTGEEFYQWYQSLDEEDQKLANGLIVISVTTAVESGSNTVGELRKHVYGAFKVLKKEEANR